MERGISLHLHGLHDCDEIPVVEGKVPSTLEGGRAHGVLLEGDLLHASGLGHGAQALSGHLTEVKHAPVGLSGRGCGRRGGRGRRGAGGGGVRGDGGPGRLPR